jgi:hypothetical protein
MHHTRRKIDMPLVPWFCSNDMIHQLRQILPPAYHKRFSAYFQRYGCIRCGRKDRVYRASGLCLPCHGLITDRLKRCDKILKQTFRGPSDNGAEEYLKRMRSARDLLRDLQPAVNGARATRRGFKRRLRERAASAQFVPSVDDAVNHSKG